MDTVKEEPVFPCKNLNEEAIKEVTAIVEQEEATWVTPVFTFTDWEKLIEGIESPVEIWSRYREASEQFTPKTMGTDRRQRATMITIMLMTKIGKLCGHVGEQMFDGQTVDPLDVMQSLGEICRGLAFSSHTFSLGNLQGPSSTRFDTNLLQRMMLLTVKRKYPELIECVVGLGKCMQFSLSDILGMDLVQLHKARVREAGKDG